MMHDLKCIPPYFQKVYEQEKNFEIRKNDRDYQAGDKLRLREYNQDTNTYTGRELRVDVSYVFNGGKYGVEEGYCVLGLYNFQYN